MVSRFEKYVKTGADAKPTRANANRFEQYQKPEPEVKEPSWAENAGNFGLDVLRNFNDTLTFGLYPKAVDAVSGNDNQQKLLEQSNGAAQLIGDTAGYILPGLGVSTAVAKAVPKLAGNTIPAIMGREAASSGVISAADDLIREGSIDPMGVAIDTGIGGATGGIFAGISRGISPEARVRAGGNGMSEQDKLITEATMRRAEGVGVDLTIPEAARVANPESAVPISRMYNDALQTPKGSAVAQTFEAGRGPRIAQIGNDIISEMGPGASPFDVSAAAEDAITRNRAGVNAAAQPLYDAAAIKKAPPTWLPKNDPAYPTIVEGIQNDVVLMRKLQQEWTRLGGKGAIPANSGLFQDAVKKQADELAGQAFGKGSNYKGSIFAESAEAVRNNMDRVAPTYSAARDIAEAGGERISNLEAGPLGQVIDTPSAKGQGSIMFGADNAVDAGLSQEALDQLAMQNADLPRGILANHLDSALSENPGNWANAALPNPHARGIAMGIAPNTINDARFNAASAVTPFKGEALPGYDSNPIGWALAGLRNAGKGKVARVMQDADMVPKLGRTGPVQRTLTQAGIGTATQARKRRNQRNRRNRGED